MIAKFKAPTEHEEQTNLFKWIAETMEMQTDFRRKLALQWIHAIPNGFYRSMTARMKAKREGVTSGISDVFVPAPEMKIGGNGRGSAYHGLYIEMKRHGEAIRDTQQEFFDYLDLVQYKNALCFTWNDAARLIVAHLGLTEYAEIPEESDYERVKRLYTEHKRKIRENAKKPREALKTQKKAIPAARKAKAGSKLTAKKDTKKRTSK